MGTETLSWSQVFPLDLSKCPPHKGALSSGLLSTPSLPFQTQFHTLLQEASPTDHCPRGLTFYQPFDYIVPGLPEDSYVSPSRASAQFPLLD